MPQIRLNQIDPSPFQPPGRKAPSHGDVLALADDLLLRCQLTTIMVRPKGDRYELMGGERRLQAFRLNFERAEPGERSKWELIRAEVRDATDAEAADIVAVENLQREQLSEIDEAFTYAQLMKLHDFTQAKELAEHLKRPVRTIQRLLQIHKAPAFIRDAMAKGMLVEIGEGEGATKVHRKLDREQALVFVRLFENLANEIHPESAKEIEEARAALAKTKAMPAAENEKQSVRIAREEKAQDAVDRAIRRGNREAERRASARVQGAIERALGEGWSFRRVESFYKLVTEAPSDSGAETARPAFTDDGKRLVVYRERVAAVSGEERENLVGLLKNLLAQIPTSTLSSGVRDQP